MSTFEPKPIIRASLFGAMQRCPGILELSQRLAFERKECGNANTSLGQLGHMWLEQKLMGFEKVADHILEKAQLENIEEFKSQLLELWNWIDCVVPEHEQNVYGALLLEHKILFPSVGKNEVMISGTIDYLHYYYNNPTAAFVADWKFYHDKSFLPRMQDDMQMLSYAVGVMLENPSFECVGVSRVLCYHLRYDHFVLDRGLLYLALAAIAAEADYIWENRNQYRIGAHCLTCLFADHCEEYKKQGKHVETRELVPYVGGLFERWTQVKNFLLALPIIEKRLAEGKEAAKEFVRINGPIPDDVSGKKWGPNIREQDEIQDAAHCLAELAKITNPQAMLAAAKTTKSGMEAVMKEVGLKPDERKTFFRRLRDLGHIAKIQSERWEWK